MDNKTVKTVVGYIEKAMIERLGEERVRIGDYNYEYDSDLLGIVLFVGVYTFCGFKKGKLSIIKQNNKVYFCVENLLEEVFSDFDFRYRFIDELGEKIYYSENRFKRSLDFGEGSRIAGRVYKLWEEQGGGAKRLENLIKEGNRIFIRGDLKIPCDGLDEKIIPIASLDLDDFKLRYLSSTSRDGGKVVVSDLVLNDSRSWSNPKLLKNLNLCYGSFKVKGNSFKGNEIRDDDKSLDIIIKKVLEECGCM